MALDASDEKKRLLSFMAHIGGLLYTNTRTKHYVKDHAVHSTGTARLA